MPLASQTSHSDAQDGSDVYILKTGEAGTKTLELQHRALADGSYGHLKKAGLSPGQTVWDVGCGSGIMTEYFAKTVGETGRVYALDISREQIKVAKKRIEAACLENVTFVQKEITDLEGFPNDEADIVYGRFILMHLKNPEKALKTMHSLLKTGGMLALQESIMSTTRACVEGYIKTLIALGQLKGVDFDIGTRLARLCQEIGFKKVQSNFFQPKMTAREAEEFFLGRSAEWEEEAIQLRLTTREQMEQWKKETVRMFSSSDYFSLAKQAYVLAQKEI